MEFTDTPLGDLSRSRIEFVAGDGLQDPVLWYGGRFQFLDLCPHPGCLAVEYATTGEVAHAWPFRPDELEDDRLLTMRSIPMSSPSTTPSSRDCRIRSAWNDTRTATCW